METNKPKWLRLNLQHFADGGDDNPTTDEPVKDETPTEPKIEFTQAELDALVQDRLARDRKKREDEAERKRLEDESEYKTLYEQAQQKIAEIETQAQADALKAKKQALLIEAGYTAEKLTDALEFITGEDEESMKTSVERFIKLAPPTPTYVDPSAGNGTKDTPETKDATEYGHELFARIKNKIR
ncbi:capsid assembly scaffolding protein Gp46 family protein [Bacillus sp. FSL K6-3431]|uniref:capsid assembly scaffolding protein Gp46 family protein n=1 Tax=Bacillus sp. FSL K6-3431 TaxID=2921500 RepID=UPI0030F6447E